MEKVDQSPPIISITPSDSTVYIPPLVGFRVGTTTGDVVVVSDGQTVTLTDVQAGETVPGAINQILSTGTTAAGIVGWQWKNLA